MPETELVDIQPIVILGTGRCGSTFLQTALCGVSDVWIWGEHDGMLQGLFRWSRDARNSDAMKKFSFPYVAEDPYVTLKRDGTRAAWITPFDASAVEDIERRTVVDLFSRRMPQGKTRWGFKEIRYGRNSGVPERMLTLFPKTKFIHVLRHPRKTISSSIRAWHPQVFDSALSSSEREAMLDAFVAAQLERWKDTTSYLEDFCEVRRNLAMTVQIETAKERLPEVIEFLEPGSHALPVEVASEFNPARQDEAVEDLIQKCIDSAFAKDAAIARIAKRVGYNA